MDLKINPLANNLNGEITAPGSKSYSHRAFIAASLADGISIIKNPLVSGDAGVTIDILRSLGIKILKVDNSSYIIERSKGSFKPYKRALDCKNSGTSIRIFSVLSLLVKGGLTLTGEFIRRKRPLLPLLNSIESLGAKFKLSNEKLQIKRKKVSCNKVKIPGNISSQFITALLIVCPLLKCDNKDYIEIELTSPLVSSPYLKITLDVLNSFGIHIQENFKEGKFYITTEQNYRAQSYEIPGDFSSASFLIAATVLCSKESKVIINNLSTKNFQGDTKIIEILNKMGANIKIDESRHQVIIEGNLNNYPLKGVEIDCHDIPDLFPILAVLGAFAEGKTTLFNALHLRSKECDRISVIARELEKMGVEVIEESDRLTILRCNNLKGINVDHDNDHRIAMACSIAALYASSSSQIKNIDIVNDSYPTFLNDLKKLGAQLELV
ncbi:MAG: 3-phosphoshikimate 1-carboxyvinyltransferase [Promethearchaeota archaeon]